MKILISLILALGTLCSFAHADVGTANYTLSMGANPWVLTYKLTDGKLFTDQSGMTMKKANGVWSGTWGNGCNVVVEAPVQHNGYQTINVSVAQNSWTMPAHFIVYKDQDNISISGSLGYRTLSATLWLKDRAVNLNGLFVSGSLASSSTGKYQGDLFVDGAKQPFSLDTTGSLDILTLAQTDTGLWILTYLLPFIAYS